ncbi:DUF3105 domain-containing protein [Streptomyces sp. NPDC050485]|uniref:DUF3105 domain-containing protein n=1 Tax=Streptomyces sp. NPDC050485 TaxID=3365617 RepID=UPI0037A532BF
MGSANSKGSAKAKAEARRARIEEQRRAERARERRNRILTITAATAVLAATGIGGWYLYDKAEQKQQATAAPVPGEQSWTNLARSHVNTPVSYPMSPPPGGNHNPVWVSCDAKVYTKEVPDENAVHALEHGAVWVTYNDKAAQGDVQALGAKVSATPYSFMSPYKDEDSPITLTAWGHQVKVDKASDPRVGEFLEKYVQGKQTPEPGASCSGGMTP